MGLLSGRAYLAIFPWVMGFNRFTTLTANNVIVGSPRPLAHLADTARLVAWLISDEAAWVR
jgi:SPW repeat